MPDKVQVLELDVNLTTVPSVVRILMDWAQRRESRYVCIANVHMCMECHDHPDFREVVNGADLVVPDGRPLVWMQYLLGHRKASQVRGSDLTLALCEQAGRAGVSVGFYGGTPGVLDRLLSILQELYPDLKVAFLHSPPFRALTHLELTKDVERINASGVGILFVGLGCPKQERLMAQQRGSVQAVMLGVGAAFDFLAGAKPHAPRWMQEAGLEWLFRLAYEPKRLWRRYILLNPRFLWLAGKQLLLRKKKGSVPSS